MTASGFPDRTALEESQLEALRRLVDALCPANAFYAPRLAAVRSLAALAEFRECVPFTRKAELVADQLAHPPYGTNLTYPLERYTRFSQTSGTTGAPLRWLDTPESWSWMAGNWTRLLATAGVGASDRILFAFSFGPFLGFWTAFEAGQRLGALCLPGGGLSSTARLRMLVENAVTVLCCTPTYALRLAEVAAEEGVDLSQGPLRVLKVAGEPGGSLPAVRERLERAWPSAVVRDHHGMTEVGPVTYECPLRPRVLHVMEEAFLPEVIDPETGAPAPPGERGELVLTNLGRLGSPLLRYRTGDLVQPSPPGVCACGSSELALEGGILGRTDDMVVLRGVNLHPSAFDDVLRRFAEVVEYRVEVCREGPLGEVTVQIETDAACHADAVCRRVEQTLRATFNLRVPVQAVPPETLPRFEMKAKRWIRRS